MIRMLMAIALGTSVAGSVSRAVDPETEGPVFSYVNSITLDTQSLFRGTRVGGLSGIVWDRQRKVYHVPADAPFDGGSRVYTLLLNWSDGLLADAEIVNVVRLRGLDGQPLPLADLEGVALSFRNTLWVSSESVSVKDSALGSDTSWLRSFDCRTGGQVGEIELPGKFRNSFFNGGQSEAVDPKGLEFNRGIESLSISPDGKRLWTATEASLLQDRKVMGKRVSRITSYRRKGLHWHQEKQHLCSISMRGFMNSVSDILALDENRLLVLERRVKGLNANPDDFAFSLYLVDFDQEGVTDVLGKLPNGKETRLRKTRVFDSMEAGVVDPDNVEGMCFGPVINGERRLILISDNNFRDNQLTRLHALAMQE